MIIKRKEYEEMIDDLMKEKDINYRLEKENSNMRKRISELLKLVYEVKHMATWNTYQKEGETLEKIKGLITDYQSIN